MRFVGLNLNLKFGASLHKCINVIPKKSMSKKKITKKSSSSSVFLIWEMLTGVFGALVKDMKKEII